MITILVSMGMAHNLFLGANIMIYVVIDLILLGMIGFYGFIALKKKDKKKVFEKIVRDFFS